MDWVKNSLNAYVNDKVPPGGFLYAVLCNDLTNAVIKADERNMRQLREIILYVYNDLPSSCWGSEEIVKTWLEGPIHTQIDNTEGDKNDR